MSKKPLAKLVRLIKQKNDPAAADRAAKEFINRYWNMFENISQIFGNESIGNVISAAFEVIYNHEGTMCFKYLYSMTKDQLYKDITGHSRGTKLIMVPHDEYMRLLISVDADELVERRDMVRFINYVLTEKELSTLQDIVNYTNMQLQERWGMGRTGVIMRRNRFLMDIQNKLKKMVSI